MSVSNPELGADLEKIWKWCQGDLTEEQISWQFAQMSLRMATERQSGNVLAAMGLESSGGRRAGPTPTVSLQALSRLPSVEERQAVAWAVNESRISSSIRDSTGVTYSSHLNMIGWACSVLGVPRMPATLSGIRLASAIPSHPVTLRGWLAAWRAAHLALAVFWPGDQDPYLKAIRMGTQKMLAPAPPRRRLRKPRLLRFLKRAALQRKVEFGAALAICYAAALRVPSEFFGQTRRATLRVDSSSRMILGPIQRKGRSVPSTLIRHCTCLTEPLGCPHMWTRALLEHRPGAEILEGYALKDFIRDFQVALADDGIADLSGWTSHSIRRGSGTDVLYSQGVMHMLKHGEWGGLDSDLFMLP